VLARLGVSARYGGWDLVEDLKAKYMGVKQEIEKGLIALFVGLI
jgi:hypothetical protein